MTRPPATPHHTRVAARPTRHRSPANQYRHDDLRLSARIADKVTAVFGSWAFIIAQSALIVIWLGYNGYVALHYLRGGAFDPYPFILLNLLFSTQAAYAAPLILRATQRSYGGDVVGLTVAGNCPPPHAGDQVCSWVRW